MVRRIGDPPNWFWIGSTIICLLAGGLIVFAVVEIAKAFM